MNKSVMDLKYLLQSDYIILDGFRTTKDIIQEHYANIKAGMVCIHEFKDYVGLTETYKYCVKCDEKEKQ